jgi:hypothetical protein
MHEGAENATKPEGNWFGRIPAAVADRHVDPILLGVAVETVLLLVWLAIASEGITRGVMVVGAIVAGLGAYYQQRQPPNLSKDVKIWIALTVLLVQLLSLLGWMAGRLYDARRSVDVTSSVKLANNTNMMPGVHHAALEVDITAARSAVVIVFNVEDSHRELGSCRPNTMLIVTPDTAGNRGHTRSAAVGQPLTIDLLADAQHLRLDIEVQNLRNDRNCAVDVSVTSAVLVHR